MSLIASAPVNCQNAGSWIQQWNCGMNANKTGAHVSYANAIASSHNMTGVFILIGAIIGLLLITMARKGGGRAATASR